MVATCGVGSMLYVLPMLLGRSYDQQHDTVGLDIYNQKDIDDALNNPYPHPVVNSYYMTIEDSSEKRDFMGISGELSLKINSGLLSIKGSGDYLRDTSNSIKTVEVLIKMTFITLLKEIDLDAKPKTEWMLLDRDTVGTHVVTSLTYGGEVYASVKFVATKSEYLQEIKAEVLAAISKSGAFDADAQAKLEMLSQNVSSRAKMEIDYYGTVPVAGVPTTIEGVKELVDKFKDQVTTINNGSGIAVCAGFRPLSDFSDKFSFLKNKELLNALNNFNDLFDNLREAKTLLIKLVSNLLITTSDEFMKKIIDFSDRLTKTIRVFYDTIGNLDLEQGSNQLSKAEEAFDKNSPGGRDDRYTKEAQALIRENEEKRAEDPTQPRGLYILWGKKTCPQRSAQDLYSGFMSSFLEQGIGSGTSYQCLPEKPNLKVDSDAKGLSKGITKLGGVRYLNLSMFKDGGKNIEGKSAPCAVCETPSRPTIKMFPTMNSCPGDWVQEYTGFLVSSFVNRLRSEYICVDFDPDIAEQSTEPQAPPKVLPIKMGEGQSKDASIPCAVCSK